VELGRVVPRHVGRDDGGDDAPLGGAGVVALPAGRRGMRWHAALVVDDDRDGGISRRLDRSRGRGAAVARRVTGERRAAPFAVGVVVLFAGVLQGTGWKRRHLARCRDAPRPCGATAAHDDAWRHGLRLGRDCVVSCAGPMAALLAIGMMDLRAMAVVTAVISAERLAPSGERVARAAGAAAIATGLVLLARASGLG
jgi:hypothetical protein